MFKCIHVYKKRIYPDQELFLDCTKTKDIWNFCMKLTEENIVHV